MEELKTCPFCGNKAEIDECEGGDNPKIYYRLRCTGEECSMGYPDAWYNNKEELIKDWNTRIN